MRISIRTLSESNVNPAGYRNVVVEGLTPEQVMHFLPSCFVVFQNTEDDYEGVFSTSDNVLNVLKPNLYVSDNPTDFDKELCKSFNCEIVTLEELVYSSITVDHLESKEEWPKVVSSLKEQESFMLEDEEETLNTGEVSSSILEGFVKSLEEPKKGDEDAAETI